MNAETMEGRDAVAGQVERPVRPGSEARLHYPCRMCGGTGAAPPQADENDWCQHCAATGREPSKVDDELLLSLWDETAGRDDRVLAFGFAVAQHVAMVCRMDGA